MGPSRISLALAVAAATLLQLGAVASDFVPQSTLLSCQAWNAVSDSEAIRLVELCKASSHRNIGRIQSWEGDAMEAWFGGATNGDGKVTIVRHHKFVLNHTKEWLATRFVRDPDESTDKVGAGGDDYALPDFCQVFNKTSQWSYSSRDLIGRVPTSPDRPVRPGPLLKEATRQIIPNGFVSSPIIPWAMLQPGTGIFIHEEYDGVLASLKGEANTRVSFQVSCAGIEDQFVKVDCIIDGQLLKSYIHDRLQDYLFVYMISHPIETNDTSSSKVTIDSQNILNEMGVVYQPIDAVWLPKQVHQISKNCRRSLDFENQRVNFADVPDECDWTWCQPAEGTYLIGEDVAKVRIVKNGKAVLFETAGLEERSELRDSSPYTRPLLIGLNVCVIIAIGWLWMARRRKSSIRQADGNV